MCKNTDYFEMYLERYAGVPSLVIVRSLELKHFPKEFLKSPVLDLCCGNGFFSECLGIKDIFGCDIDNNVINKAKTLNIYKEVRNCDVRDLSPYSDESFDTVISNCALEHVDGIDKALGEVSRVLKKGGHLIMTVPSENLNYWYYPKIFFNKIGLKTYGMKLFNSYNNRQAHLNILAEDLWKNKLGHKNLNIIKRFYFFNENEYKFATFLDSLGGHILRRINFIFIKTTPLIIRKFFWRNLLKPIYLNSLPLEKGGELVLVAQKV